MLGKLKIDLAHSTIQHEMLSEECIQWHNNTWKMDHKIYSQRKFIDHIDHKHYHETIPNQSSYANNVTLFRSAENNICLISAMSNH
jgi:hypothetical protein